MTHASPVLGDHPGALRLPRRRGTLPLAAVLAAMLAAVIVGNRQDHEPAFVVTSAADRGAADPRPAPQEARASFSDSYGWMFDRTSTPGAAHLGSLQIALNAYVGTPAPAQTVEAVAAAPAPPQALVEMAVAGAPAAVPLPVRRPPDLVPARPAESVRLAERPLARRPAPVAVASTQVDGSSFFDRLFSSRPNPESAMAYASTGVPTAEPETRRLLGPSPAPSAGGGTAVYDISAGAVTLPSGERLEAHSGLRQYFDDPRYVHLTMRGATPPGTYDLTEREALFHGVRAIRLTPVGGSGAIHGRVGLLAHTYMLGPRGDSNGCVSFRQYERFLQAFLRGEVRRLVVVAGSSSGARYADAR